MGFLYRTLFDRLCYIPLTKHPADLELVPYPQNWNSMQNPKSKNLPLSPNSKNLPLTKEEIDGGEISGPTVY